MQCHFNRSFLISLTALNASALLEAAVAVSRKRERRRRARKRLPRRCWERDIVSIVVAGSIQGSNQYKKKVR